MQHRPTPLVSPIAGIALTIAACWSVPARAIDLDDCKLLEDDSKRLACYDSATGRNADRAAQSAAAQTPAARAGSGVAGAAAGLIAKLAPDPARPGARPSSLAERWDLDIAPNPELFALRAYKPIYILPAFYSTSPNLRPSSPNPDNNATLAGPIDHLEGKFQVSGKAKLLNDVGVTGGAFWFGYTQTSHWQVYNSERSRPFRETNYEPELIYTAPTNYSIFGLDGRLVGLSLTHQSNGQDVPRSRSWNRVIGQIGLENDDWALLVRPWLRLREKVAKDDNPDILDYVGRGELVAIRKLGNQQIAVTLRHSLKTGDRAHGSLAVDWAFPVYGYLKGHVQLFTGYGESLIDYNHRQNSIGVGVSVGEWL